MVSKEPTLLHLLEKQLEYYRATLRLEQQLAEMISSSDFSALRGNTSGKKELMQAIESTYAQLEPMLQRQRDADGALLDAHCEKLRSEAVGLLKQIVDLEAENLEAMRKDRAESIAGLEMAGKARRAARGYKPSKQSRTPRHLLDTTS